MEYSSDKVMTRKEYLKSKRKGKLWIRIVKYSLLLVVFALLSIYLFKQLDIYNNVTKIANKVVEETALARTLNMYYVAEGYTKDAPNEVVLYKAYDESRTKIAGTEKFSNISIVNDKLYGLVDNKLCYIDLITNEKKQITEHKIKQYIISDNKIYCSVDTDDFKEVGIYLYDMTSGEMKKHINVTVQYFMIDDNYIYIISKGKTEKSIVRYLLNGSGRTIITDKEIVTYMRQDKNNIYFIANEQLYCMKKNGKATELIIQEKMYVDSDIKNNTSNVDAFIVKDDMVYYIENAENKTLCAYNMKTDEKHVLSKKNVESIQLEENILYYKVNNDIGIYKINIENGKTEHVTNIRGNEYICIK